MKKLYYILVFFVFCGCTCTLEVEVEGLEYLVPEGGLINIPEHVVDIDMYNDNDDDSGVDNEKN